MLERRRGATCSISPIAVVLVAFSIANSACSGDTHSDGDAQGGDAQGGDGGGAGAANGGTAASGGRPVNPGPCDSVAPTACAEPAPTYAVVEPIFQQRCVVCHAGSSNGLWPLTDYGHVASWEDTIRAAMLQCSMPPSDSGMTIETAERNLLLQWIRCGMPE